MSKIGYLLQYKSLPTTVLGNNGVLRIHRRDRYKLSPAQMLKNIGMQDITLDTEQIALSSCQIETLTVRQSCRLDISKGYANMKGIRDVTSTKIAIGPPSLVWRGIRPAPTWSSREEQDLLEILDLELFGVKILVSILIDPF